LNDPEGINTEFPVGSDTRWYDVHRSPLVDPRGFRMGELLLLRDVTEQRRVQALQLDRQRESGAVAERRRMARDLHDDLSQKLGFINVQIQAVAQLLATGRPEEAGTHLGRLAEVARDAQAHVRELIAGWRAARPEQSFARLLRRAVEDFGLKHGIPLEVRLTEEQAFPELDAAVEGQLLRIVLEALANVSKHARARKVLVTLAGDSGGIGVTVEDDGVGFDPQKAAGADKAFGLRIMAERAAEVGGTLRIISEPGRGTRVTVWASGPRIAQIPG